MKLVPSMSVEAENNQGEVLRDDPNAGAYDEVKKEESMPYAKRADLPADVKKLPGHAQDIFRAAFNAALEKYGDEPKAFAIAHAAANRYVDKGKVLNPEIFEDVMRKALGLPGQGSA